MQETVSGYKFRIFHHCPGGRAWGRLAVVELAAGGFSCPHPGQRFLEDKGPFPRKSTGSAPGSLSLGSGMDADSPAQRLEQGVPKIPVASGLWHSGGNGGFARRFRYTSKACWPATCWPCTTTFQMHEDAFATRIRIHLRVTKFILPGIHFFYQWLVKI